MVRHLVFKHVSKHCYLASPDDKWWHKARQPEVPVIQQKRVVLLANKNWRKSRCTRHYCNISTVPESLRTTASQSFCTIRACSPHIAWEREKTAFILREEYVLIGLDINNRMLLTQVYCSKTADALHKISNNFPCILPFSYRIIYDVELLRIYAG